MSKTKMPRETKLKVVTGILAFVLLLSTALLLMSLWERQQGRFPAQASQSAESVIEYDGRSYHFDASLQTVLVMGLDKYAGEEDETAYTNDKQADFLMLLVFDDARRVCSALHINRDTMVQVNVLGVAGQKIGSAEKQIALAHTYGNGKQVSCRNTSDAVSSLLMGVKIDHYVSMTMDSVAVFNDLVGGVTLTVQDDFSGIDDTLVKGETVTLNGEQAFHYVRTRYGLEDSSNSTRMTRQRQYLQELLLQTQERVETDAEFVVEASAKMSEYLVSDCTVTQLQTLFEKLTSYQFDEIHSLEGESVVGEQFMEFYADESSVRALVTKLFCKPED